MSMFYTEVAQIAHELLTEFGGTGAVKIITPGVYDPETGSSATTEVTQSVTLAMFDYPQDFINGTTVLQGDQKVFMSAVGLTMPAAGAVLTWQGADYAVIAAKALAPAGVNVLAELQARK